MAFNKFQTVRLSVKRGDKETFPFDVTEGGVAKDLTGYTIKSQAREELDDAEPLYDITFSDGSDGNDYLNGRVVLVLPAATTADLPDVCHFDIQATLGTTVITLVQGQLELSKDVTQ